MNRIRIIVMLTLVFVLRMNAQYKYITYDQFLFRFQQINSKNNSEGLDQHVLKSTGAFYGAGFRIPFGDHHSAGIGIGITDINYQKQWTGVFPEGNGFGAVVLKGNIRYWSFPLSITFTSHSGRGGGCFGSRRNNWHFGLNLTYIPSFEGKNSYSVKTFGSADSSWFAAGLRSNEREFQHTFNLGLSNRFMLFRGNVLVDLQSFVGIGSSYFADSGTKLNNLSYGIRVQIGFSARVPRISIYKETNKDYSDKKKELQQKQNEIQQQLRNKN